MTVKLEKKVKNMKKSKREKKGMYVRKERKGGKEI